MADDNDDEYVPVDRCDTIPRRKSICSCSCRRALHHTGPHYCSDCGWIWGPKGTLTDEQKQEAR